MAEGGRENTVIDVESLASSMENKLGNPLSFSPDRCIFRTPIPLARPNPKAYRPNCFSFGPYHHDEANLKVTEKIKLRYLQDLLSRSDDPGTKLRECLSSIDEVEGKACECYAENIDQYESQNFVEMLVVDGCFIIELFLKSAAVVPIKDDDPIFSMSFMLQFLMHDLILLENQIPWLVLEILFNITNGHSDTKSLVELALLFFRDMFSDDAPFLGAALLVDQMVKHILDLLRLSLVLPSEEVRAYERNGGLKYQKNLELKRILSATRLREAGVKFVRIMKNSILDIKFTHGVLEIPSLMIQETTETIFRNLIAYEQCLPHCRPIFTSYAMVLGSLIGKPGDIDILSKREILYIFSSLEDATQFFKKLYNDTYVKEFCYSKLCEELDYHCSRSLPRWRASYVQNFLIKPYAVVGQVYAALMFFLTLWQTYFKKG